jgi:hypothetical protein
MELRKKLDDLLAKGFFVRPSKSPLAFLLLFVEKDGSKRLCLDYRDLNVTTINNKYPLSISMCSLSN